MLEIDHTDLSGLPRNCSLIWTQKVLQATEIVFPCQPLLLRVWMEISIQLKGLEIKFACVVRWQLCILEIKWVHLEAICVGHTS